MDRQIRSFYSFIENANEELGEEGFNPIIVVEDLAYSIFQDINEYPLSDLQEEMDEFEQDIEQINMNYEQIKQRKYNLTEYVQVLEISDYLFSEEGIIDSIQSYDDSFEMMEYGENIGLGSLRYITGTINFQKKNDFHKICWRVSRGNIYAKFEEIEGLLYDIDSQSFIQKVGFSLVIQGEILEHKLIQVCESFRVQRHNVSPVFEERVDKLHTIQNDLDDLQLIEKQTHDQIYHMLEKLSHRLDNWKYRVHKEKGIAHTMNKFHYDTGDKCLIGEGWIPTEQLDEAHMALDFVKVNTGAQIPPLLQVIESDDTPPTYFPTDKLTKGFQAIISSYGIPRYKEINPAALTVITFPFQFGVMFGDLGHGFLLLLFALYMLYKENDWAGKKLNEMIEILFSGRYIILLMALFSIYVGAIYNECFSIPIDFFGSNWELVTGENSTNTSYYPIDINRAYPFGVDPVWKGSENELLYYNSLKMKISVVIGVTHMVAGLYLKLLNGIYFKKVEDIFFEFVPQVLFLLCLFGYLSFLIFFKWTIPFLQNDLVDVNNRTSIYDLDTQQAPLLLNVLIYMFLPTSNDLPELYPNQSIVEWTLVILSFICIPLMLIPKPIILNMQYKKRMREGGEQYWEEFDIKEIIVHQSLETIEFILGTISHTASYLRLWALSLAHAELSTVFWELAFAPALSLGIITGSPYLSIIGSIVGFAIWGSATLIVIMSMEGLSAFLHALRLHWVEFQSKFYAGDGRKFMPFSYTRMKKNLEKLDQ
eukprot:TRINITY_DN1629_c0_g1_i2.p1 TRINITY_DN1629_c0_g1~~TRINITY_DN1629_c0_g1_i2.p1  ORF type:complete len:763 (-),score=154.42 TRINITY_DN1629_c0_g1_i2:65-2353(-)